MNAKRIATINKLCALATPGPLRLERVDHDDGISYQISSDAESEVDHGFHVIFHERDYRGGENDRLVRHPKHDAEFYVEARSALPEAIAEITKLRQALTKLAAFARLFKGDTAEADALLGVETGLAAEVRVGQIWKDNDPRERGERFLQIQICDPGSKFAVAARIRKTGAGSDNYGRLTRISIKRLLKGGSTGYTLVRT